MSALVYILPIAIAYTILRAVMYHRAGKKMWMIQMIIFGSFVSCIWLYELWRMLFVDG